MRGKIILNIIIVEENVTMKMLIDKLKISDRNVRYELSVINKDGEKNGFKIVNTRAKGYSLEIRDREKFDKYIERMNSSTQLEINLSCMD